MPKCHFEIVETPPPPTLPPRREAPPRRTRDRPQSPPTSTGASPQNAASSMRARLTTTAARARTRPALVPRPLSPTDTPSTRPVRADEPLDSPPLQTAPAQRGIEPGSPGGKLSQPEGSLESAREELALRSPKSRMLANRSSSWADGCAACYRATNSEMRPLIKIPAQLTSSVVLLISIFSPLSGCASAQRAGTTSGGAAMWRIECPPAGGCDEKAREVCDGDYTTISDGDSYDVISIQNEQPVVARRSRFLIACLDRNSFEQPKFRVEQSRQADQAAVARDAARRRVRANPPVPELGSTSREAEALCRQHGGRTFSKPYANGTGVVLTCKVGNARVFLAFMREGIPEISVVKVFYEGHDISATRFRIESEAGPANRVEMHEGYRAWIWDHANPQIDLRSYDAGVAITRRTPNSSLRSSRLPNQHQPQSEALPKQDDGAFMGAPFRPDTKGPHYSVEEHPFLFAGRLVQGSEGCEESTGFTFANIKSLSMLGAQCKLNIEHSADSTGTVWTSSCEFQNDRGIKMQRVAVLSISSEIKSKPSGKPYRTGLFIESTAQSGGKELYLECSYAGHVVERKHLKP